jgi:16S rRNA (uracil1498-N3)-methyltransferase
MTAGDTLILFDGSGGEYPGKVETATKSRVCVSLGDAQSPEVESPLHISLWHGLCKGDRMDNVVQKATELGVREIQPVVTEHGVVRLDSARSRKKTAHWCGIAISACEQSGRVIIPVVHPPMALAQALQNLPELTSGQARLMFDPSGTDDLAQQLVARQEVIVLTGPEGGFSQAEKDAASAASFRLVKLGPRILRTETAPLAALSLVQSISGDL